ncbi:MAG TPA: HEAT repeat domain-containing protein [Longimicrobium sp.]|jgi:HEAT repeat protein
MHIRTVARVLLAAALAAAPLAAQGRQEIVLAGWAAGSAVREWPQDPAHELYTEGREALNDDDYARAARLFQRVRQDHPRSRYVPDALYWEAFARYRIGGNDQLRMALGGLDALRRDHPRATARRDADELATRIRGELARRGDSRAAERVTQGAERAVQECGRGGDDDTRTAALNALLQMDADQALPILRRVLARRDACSEELRKHAVFLVAQKRNADTENLLLSIARDDPSSEVREQAVFWLSQVGTERAVDILGEILRSSRDAGLQEKAVFALSQHRSPRAAQLLRQTAEQAGPRSVREQAIFWLGQRRSQENAEYLRGLFRRLDDRELKDKVIFSLSQMRGVGNDRWLLEVARDESQPEEVRKQAIFWASQAGVPLSDVSDLYDRVRDPEVKEQIIFALSQRGREAAAIDKLIQIAKSDRDPKMREKAVFWLGQSRDPRATRAIQEIIDQ